MGLLQQNKAHPDGNRRFAGGQAIVRLFERKPQPPGGLQHAVRGRFFHRRAFVEYPVDGGHADVGFARNVGKRDFAGGFFHCDDH